jgi:phosphatidylserine/phosphatidylglycerophosphate/cardiolipin synthase-like enzyme
MHVTILLPLHEAVKQRGVEVGLFVDVPDPDHTDKVIRSCWPFGDPFPKLFCDARVSRDASMHAKCVVVDHAIALVTSANFTSRGHERNIEVGVLIHDSVFAGTLERHWMSAVEGGLFRRMR